MNFYKLTGDRFDTEQKCDTFLMIEAKDVGGALSTYDTLRRAGKLNADQQLGEIRKIERVFNVFVQSDLGPTGTKGPDDSGIA